MLEKKNRFEADLDQLITKGELLLFAIQHECVNGFEDRLMESIGENEAKDFIENLPNFKNDYQAWYSEALSLVKQTLPDRLKDFTSYYEYPRVRKEIDFQNYMIRDFLQGLGIERRGKIVVGGSAAIPEFRQQLNIIQAAKSTLSSTLIDLTTVLQSDLFDSEIDSAEALGKAGYLRAAGAICGVVIEKHLKQVCKNHNIAIRKRKPTISDFNQALKDNKVVSTPSWRFVQHLTDIRNICDHDTGREPTRDDIDGLLDGTRKILKTIF